jgi:molecular chaperone Hsp33
MSDLPDTDFTQRFIFDDSDVRGEMVALDAATPKCWPSTLSGAGRAIARRADGGRRAAGGHLKFDGLLILQARSEGPIPLLMIECSSEREIRGLARYEAEQIAPDATLPT